MTRRQGAHSCCMRHQMHDGLSQLLLRIETKANPHLSERHLRRVGVLSDQPSIERFSFGNVGRFGQQVTLRADEQDFRSQLVLRKLRIRNTVTRNIRSLLFCFFVFLSFY